MKSKITALFGVLALGFAQAATTSYSNLVNFDSSTNAVVTVGGTPLAVGSGFVGVGYFASLTDILISTSIDAVGLGNDFRTFASGQINGGGVGLAGLYNYGTATVANAQFDGKAVYTVIGNGATIATSTQILIAKHTTTFAADPAITPGAVLSNSSSGNVATLLKGSYGLFSSDFGAGPSQAYSLALLVPEPSTMLLGAFGALGLLRRRR
jgi:hypothetical protein